MTDSYIPFHLTWKITLNKHYFPTAEWFWVMTDKAKNEISKAATLLHCQDTVRAKTSKLLHKPTLLKNVKNNVNLTLFSSLLWRYKKWTIGSKGWYMVGAPEKMKPRGRCGPRPVVSRPLAYTFMDSVQTTPCETLNATSRLSAGTISSIWLTNVIDVAGRPLLSSSMTLTHPFATSQHYSHTCSTVSATTCLWMFTGSVFCTHRNRIRGRTSSLLNSFSRVIIFQKTLRQRCMTCTSEGACRLAVGPCTNVWQNNSLLRSSVSQE